MSETDRDQFVFFAVVDVRLRRITTLINVPAKQNTSCYDKAAGL